MLKNLHPIVSVSIGLLVLNFVVAPFGGDVYEQYLRPVLKVLNEWLSVFGNWPYGLLTGLAIGGIAGLYLLRGRAPDWYKRFNKSQARFDGESISAATLLRNYVHPKSGYEVIRGKQFYSCQFHGPGIFYMMHGTTFGPGNNWNNMGNPLPLETDESITGCVGFQNCHFEGCTFDHITPVVGAEQMLDFVNTFNADVRKLLKPKLIEAAEAAAAAAAETAAKESAKRPAKKANDG